MKKKNKLNVHIKFKDYFTLIFKRVKYQSNFGFLKKYDHICTRNQNQVVQTNTHQGRARKTRPN